MEVAMKEYNAISGNIQGTYHEAAVKLGISDSEMNILYVLCSEGNGCKQSAMYKQTGMTRSTVNSAIRKMEKDGILYLAAGEGRNTCVNLTDMGKKHLEATAAKIIAIERKIWLDWTKEEREIFLRLNRRYARQLKEKIDSLEVQS